MKKNDFIRVHLYYNYMYFKDKSNMDFVVRKYLRQSCFGGCLYCCRSLSALQASPLCLDGDAFAIFLKDNLQLWSGEDRRDMEALFRKSLKGKKLEDLVKEDLMVKE